MKTYLLFWTYFGNYADHPQRVQANNPFEAVEQHPYSDNTHVRFLVFEVGGDLVFDGTRGGHTPFKMSTPSR